MENNSVQSHKAKAIMIQGTMSNAGKSMLCTALCRIFAQDGYRVAPFKSQNMALNSFVTKDGLEMGRAQVAQAEAAFQEPEVAMNPILLKPTTDVGSQVIVNGRAIGNMRAVEYFKYKTNLIPDIMAAYKKLEENYDIIVIEGAGSPVELNLKDNDIVNMGLARMLNVPVILVGDIDRGGIFAQIFGTVELLEEDERKLLKGFIVNKFRGDAGLFSDGVKKLEELTHKPCLGVAKYSYADIDDEDSQSDRLGDNGRLQTIDKKCTEINISNCNGEVIDIVVIRLPRMSNYTDFNALSRFRNVKVRFVNRLEEVGNPDMIIVPGTKSTIQDCEWLKKTGFDQVITDFAKKGGLLMGICGGLQILGENISDLSNTEGGGSVRGLGLLDIETTFLQEKNLTRTSCIVEGLSGVYEGLNGTAVSGYEMHMGSSGEGNAFLQRENVLATYIHGCFDDGLAEALIGLIASRKGFDDANALTVMENGQNGDYRAYKEEQYDLLARDMRDCLDMDKIYEIMGIDKAIG